MPVTQIGYNDDDGTIMGSGPTKKIAFFGAVPVVQRAAAAGQTAISTSASVSGAFGYTSVQANQIIVAINEIQAALRAYGLLP